ncbi:MAG: DUF805 domain-containing protein [Pseudonocardia sp.]
MTFPQAIVSGFSQYGNMRGRASPSEYWNFLLFCVACYALAGLLSSATKTAVIFVLVYVAIVIPTLCVSVRRLHDTDHSGAWWFVSLLPLGFIVLLVFYCLPSDRGPNRYGPPPPRRWTTPRSAP